MFEWTKYKGIIEVNNAQLDTYNDSLFFDCLKRDRALPDKIGLPIGTANCRQLAFNCVTDEVLEGTSFLYHAITTDDTENGANTIIGTFNAVQASKSNGIYSILALDLMHNANKPYTTALTFPTTINAILAESAANCGLTLDTFTLVNGEHEVAENPFTSGESHLNVWAYIAEVNAGFFHMRYDENLGDLLTFTVPDISQDALCEAQPADINLTLQLETLALNTVKIRDNLSGGLTTSGDSTGGILLIEDNPLCSTQTAREALITGIVSTIATGESALKFYPYIAKMLDPRLNPGDRIRVIDTAANEYETFVFSMKSGQISAEAQAQSIIPYEYPKTPVQRQAIKANKVALNAQTSANGKNTVYYDDTEPTGGTYIEGDVWFDTANGNKVNIYHLTAGVGAWTAVQYGTAAFAANSITAESGIIASLDAAKITTGEITGIAATFGGGDNIPLTIKDANGNVVATLGQTVNFTVGNYGYERCETYTDEHGNPFLRFYDNTNTVVTEWGANGYKGIGGLYTLTLGAAKLDFYTGSIHTIITQGSGGSLKIGNNVIVDFGYLDTDGTLAANSDLKLATQKATKTYADTKLPLSGGTMTEAPYVPATQRPHVALTSNSAPSPYTASASSEYSSTYAAWKAFDKDTSTNGNGWASAAADAAPWLRLDMGVNPNTGASRAEKNIVVTLINRTATAGTNGIISGKIYGCNTSSTTVGDWTQIGTITGRDGATGGASTTHSCGNSTAYRYVIVKADTWNQAAGAYCAIGEEYVDGNGQLSV